ncbi:hypothetical protein Lal_00029103 [Lupinus albus]|uniref:Uncharacterized protein n=1 Tax=Lupinus albus TaxID=3870 RepID=A0A6A4NV40_LUPAL|nr:hypothetical protein Lalb_Chr19g0135231 [Lupinus albus]KAF1885214.1 hypothetical protein Lal_00029103 [Lupinus albus]
MVKENEEVSFADTVFGFWEEFQDQSENSSNSSSFDEDYDDEEESFCGDEKNKAFWEEQEHLLQGTLCRTSSIETKVRHATKEALRELNMSERVCICQRPEAAAASVKTKTCRDCLQRELRDRLLKLGYNCFICKSKWISSPGIPSGEHTYLEVIDKSNSKRGEVKVVIELSFRGEFEMARANEEYNKLLRKLPQVFVGKSERLKVLVKIICSAAKKCMKDKKMHLAPWRKQKYMLAKWLGTYDRSILEPLPSVYTAKPQKPKTSMLTFDLLENITSLHCNNAVEVV